MCPFPVYMRPDTTLYVSFNTANGRREGEKEKEKEKGEGFSWDVRTQRASKRAETSGKERKRGATAKPTRQQTSAYDLAKERNSRPPSPPSLPPTSEKNGE
jgi:hypothetical protein